MTTTTSRRIPRGLAVGAAVLLAVMAAKDARGEGFISPLIGFNFSGDANCPNISGCDDKRLNFGVALGGMNAVIGFEEEFSYARDFFGSAPFYKSSVFTLMSNVMLVPKIGPVRPYVLGGVGLIKSHVELTTASLLSTDNNNFGWDFGGGVMITIVPHVAIRGDIRHFHSFQDLGPIPLPLANTKLDFGRAAAALTFTF